MQCTNLHILISIIVIVAGIVLVMSLYIINFTVTIGTINGIIFYANIVSINDSVFFVNDSVFKPLRVFISFTNLDLGITTCFYNGMDNYQEDVVATILSILSHNHCCINYYSKSLFYQNTEIDIH